MSKIFYMPIFPLFIFWYNEKIGKCIHVLYRVIYFSDVLLPSLFRSLHFFQVINDLLDPTGQNLRIREDAQVLKLT